MVPPVDPLIDSPAPVSVRVIAALLIAQGAVRFLFLANTLIMVGARILAPTVLLTALLLPGAMAILAIPAGILIFGRSPIARTFGLVACAILLVAQLYYLATALWAYSVISQPPIMFLVTLLVLSPITFCSSSPP